MDIRKWVCVLVLAMSYSCFAMEKLTSAWGVYNKMLEDVIKTKVAEQMKLAQELMAAQTELTKIQNDPGYHVSVWDGAEGFLAKARTILGVGSDADLSTMISDLSAGAGQAKKLQKEYDSLKKEAGDLSEQLDDLGGQITEYSPGYIAGLKKFVDLLTKNTGKPESNYGGPKGRIETAINKFAHVFETGDGSFALDAKSNLVAKPGVCPMKTTYNEAYRIFKTMAENLATLGGLAGISGGQLRKDLNFVVLFNARATPPIGR